MNKTFKTKFCHFENIIPFSLLFIVLYFYFVEQIGPKFCVGPHMTPRMLMDAQNHKQKLSPKVFVFVF